MAKFEVIKAHDGIAVGVIKTLTASAITRHMVKNGYWREIVDTPAEEQPKPAPAPKRSKGKKK